MYTALKFVCMSTISTVSSGNKVTMATAGLLINIGLYLFTPVSASDYSLFSVIDEWDLFL